MLSKINHDLSRMLSDAYIYEDVVKKFSLNSHNLYSKNKQNKIKEKDFKRKL